MTTKVSHQLLDIPTLEIVNRRFVGGPYATYPASWSNVELNTILLDEIGGISISNGFQIVGLPAGKYVVSGWHSVYAGQYTQIRLYDATNSDELARGNHTYSNTQATATSILGPNKVVVPSGATVALQRLTGSGGSDGNISVQAAFGFADYASIRFERVS